MQEKSKFISLLSTKFDFYKTSKLIFIIFCIAFFSTTIMYMFGLLSQLIYPGIIEIWVGVVCLSTMFGFALSNFAVAKEQDKFRSELSTLRQDLAEIEARNKQEDK